MEPVGKFYNN